MPSSKYPGQRSKGLMRKRSRVPIMPRSGNVQIVNHFDAGLKYLVTDNLPGSDSFQLAIREIVLASQSASSQTEW